MKICPHCNFQVDNDQAYLCPNCGRDIHKVEVSSGAPSPSSASSSSSVPSSSGSSSSSSSSPAAASAGKGVGSGLLAWSIVNVLLCTIPGIVALALTIKGRAQRDEDKREHYFSSAKLWNIVATIAGVALIAGLIVANLP